MPYPQLLLLLLLVPGCLSVVGEGKRRFMPRANAQLANKRNYLGEELPCHEDILSFSTNGEQSVIANLNKPIDVSEIEFPDVGIIYLDDDVIIGGLETTDEWQCKKRENITRAYFDEYSSDQDVYDPNTWDEMNALTAPKFELHMNRVPGASDEVEIYERNSLHLKLYDEFAVKKWIDYGREMTTDDFVKRLRTLEGQLAFQLGPRLVKEYDVEGIALMRPVGEPIRVGEFKGSYNENHNGRRNPNMDNKTLSSICAHVHCDSEAERVPPRCLDTFIPKGHCCPVCGALFEVQTYQKKLGDLELIFSQFSEKFRRANQMRLDQFFHVPDIERVDESDFEYQYQILLVIKDNDTYLDGDRLISATTLFLATLGEYWHQTEGFTLIDFKESSRDHSFETSSIILGIIFFCLFSVIATFYFSAEARNQTRILYRRGRVLVEGLRASGAPAEVEMSENLVCGGGGEQDPSSECESEATPISFANRAFSFASLDKEDANKEGTLVDFNDEEQASEAENEPGKEMDADGMSHVDLL